MFSVSVVGPLGTHPVPGRPGPAQAAQASGPFKNPPSSQGYHAQVTWSAGSQSGISVASSGGEAVESRVLLTLCSELVSTLGWQRKLYTGLRDTFRDITLQSRDIVTLHTADRDEILQQCGRQRGFTHTDLLCLQSYKGKQLSRGKSPYSAVKLWWKEKFSQ